MMKQSKDVNEHDINAFIPSIKDNYFVDIYRNLFDEGYLIGLSIETDYSGTSYILSPSQVRITIKGIEYLQENSEMKHALKWLKKMKASIPGF